MEVFFGSSKYSNVDDKWSLEFKVVKDFVGKILIRVYLSYKYRPVGSVDIPEELLDILVDKRSKRWDENK